MATKGWAGLADGVAEVFEFLEDELADDAGLAGQRLGDAEGAGVLAMGGAEGVVDVNVGQFGEQLGEVGVVLFLFLVEAEIFQEQDFAVLEGGGELFDGGADAVVGELHGLAEELGEAGGAGLEGVFGFGSALGSAEVGHEDEASAAAERCP